MDPINEPQFIEPNHHLIENDIATGRLFKTYVLCPKIENHVNIQNATTVTFADSLIPHIDKVLTKTSILFLEDEPRKQHQFASPDTAMLVIIVPENIVISVNGILTLKRRELNKKIILGVYLYRDTDQFFSNAEFDINALIYRQNI